MSLFSLSRRSAGSIARNARNIMRNGATAAAASGTILILANGGAARAQTTFTITTLYNTGVDSSGNVLSNGTQDSHYTITSANYSNPGTTTYANGYPYGASDTASTYIAPDTQQGGAAGGSGNGFSSGNYIDTFSTTFTLAPNVNLSTVNIAGQWASDNEGLDILINGHSLGLTNSGFNSFSSFSIADGYYTTGTNTLAFKWENDGGPGGLNVDFTSKTFTVTPEPSVYVTALSLASMTGIGLVRGRRRSRKSSVALSV